MVFLMADQPFGDPKQIAEAFVVKTNRETSVEVTAAGPVKIGAIDAYRIQLKSGGRLVAIVTFIPYRGATWRITGVSPSRAAAQYRGRFLNTARSFRPLRREERNSIVETLLHLVAALEGDSVVALGQRSSNHWDPATTAVYNGVFTNHRFRGGERVKIARVQPYRAADD
jgi:predicted Zn-dependent protease